MLCALVCTGPRAASAVPAAEQDLAHALALGVTSPCFDVQSLSDEVEHWLERDSVDSRLRVHVYEVQDSVTFSIALGSRQPLVRTFGELPDDCAARRSAVALSIALAIDAVAPPRARNAPRWMISGSPALSTPYPDAVAFGGQATVEAAVTPSFRPALGALVAVAADQPVRSDLPVRFDAWLAAARLYGCWVIPVSDAGFSLCAGPWLGASSTVARGLDDARSETRFFWAAAVALELEVHFTRTFGLLAGIDGLGALRKSAVRVADADGNTVAERALPRFVGTFRLGPAAFF